jgi:hypothetical protein
VVAPPPTPPLEEGEGSKAVFGEIEEMGFGTELKLGQVPRFRCSEAVLEGLEAEKTASHNEHRSFTAFGRPVSVLWTNIGSK